MTLASYTVVHGMRLPLTVNTRSLLATIDALGPARPTSIRRASRKSMSSATRRKVWATLVRKRLIEEGRFGDRTWTATDAGRVVLMADLWMGKR